LFNFGRYLFISSSAVGGSPPNLQGVWNGDLYSRVSSDYTIDENIQMTHWHALAGNLQELTEPYFRYFESTLDDWKANAKAFYGCRGALAPLRQSDNGLMSENMPYLIWTPAQVGGATVLRLLAIHRDRRFLATSSALLKQVALFYEDFLYRTRRQMIACPSMSRRIFLMFPARPSLQ